jgi:hypothetical protein
MIGTAFTRAEARRALKSLDDAFETEAGFELAQECGAVNQIYCALLILDDYLQNSTPKPLIRARSREELYAQQVRQDRTDLSQVGASAA